MLKAKNLCKQYKTKNGPIVKALDNVSVEFEETGMVFILGKSGSGKSTLLNVLGGLDKYDSGEVIVKGKSSKDFSQADFDSYRNTFIGFIFQDYNILEEFTVSKNIGLALELQGKKADKNSINELIEQVDLQGCGNRKPNTLSGGQKQRVAIARALVKNPEIIMADEPTGALDSNTGRQVLDTLKNLSKTKLVLIVSHDREFAEYYGDRIIELADGKIISDVKKYKSVPKAHNGFEIVDDKILTIKKGTKLDADKSKILQEFISNGNEDVIVSIDSKANKEFRKFAMIDEEGNKESFKTTKELMIRNYNPEDFKLIKSKLPNKDSLKMGASGLKSKPVRLFFTIILSAVAFALFGLADTMGSYNKVENTIRSMMDTHVDYASFSKRVAQHSEDDYVDYNDAKLSQADFDKLNNDLEGFNFVPVFWLRTDSYSSYVSFSNNLYNSEGIDSYTSLYRHNIYGFVEMNEQNISRFGTLLGSSRLATSDDEIVITKYTFNIFVKAGYKANNANTKIEIAEVSDLLGKTISLEDKDFKIVGVIDTNMNIDRYSKMAEPSFGDSIPDYMISSEFSDYISNSSHALGYLNSGYYQRNFISSDFSNINSGLQGIIYDAVPSDSMYGDNYSHISNFDNSMANKVVWINTPKSSLEDTDIILSYSALTNLQFDINGTQYSYSDMLMTLPDFINNKLYSFVSSDNELNMYSSWDIMTYYNYGDEKWSGYWGYGEDLTNSQKEKIDSFLTNLDTSILLDYDSYFNENSIKDILEVQYANRISEGENWEDYSQYLYAIRDYFRYSNDFSQAYADLTTQELNVINELKGRVVGIIKPYIASKIYFRYQSPNGESYYQNPRMFNIVGYYTGKVSDDSSIKGLISPIIYDEFKDQLGGIYNFAISSMNSEDQNAVRKVVEYTYKDYGDIKYSLQNPVMSSMEQINEMIETMSKIFLYVGIGFAVFASLLLLNFITTSISYKKREIGVLRAIGARGRDVFKIFFNEAFIIAFINFALAFVGCIVICGVINSTIRNDYGILITLLNVGIRQVLLMFGVSLLVAFVSSYLPVFKISRKKPIEAIKDY